MSGGEKSRVLLGKILAKPCNLLLLDEPTHHLDVESIEALIDALEEFHGALVIVTHSELLLRRLELDTLIICHAGRQEVFHGTYDDFLEKKGFEEEVQEKKSSKSETKENKAREQEPSPLTRTSSLKTLERKLALLEETQKKELKELEKATQASDWKKCKRLCMQPKSAKRK